MLLLLGYCVKQSRAKVGVFSQWIDKSTTQVHEVLRIHIFNFICVYHCWMQVNRILWLHFFNIGYQSSPRYPIKGQAVLVDSVHVLQLVYGLLYNHAL